MLKRRAERSGSFGGYLRALLAAVMIVVGLLLFTVALAGVLGPPN